MLPKVVFDTNILISSLIFGGSPRLCLETARERIIELFTSKELLLELSEKLNKKFRWSGGEVHDAIAGIAKFATIVQPDSKINKIKSDPSDNKVLEVAQKINADFIVSGDKKHILPLKKFGKTRIITATEFLNKVIPQN